MTTSKTALITGAASGLGRALAVALARDGWQLALADINAAGLAATLDAVNAAGGQGRLELLDVTQPDQWQDLCQRLQAEWPALDLLVNNAGVACSGEVGAFPVENWRWVLDVNLLGAIYGCHACIGWLKQNPRGGHVVNIASVAATLAAPAMGAYNVSKAGIVAFSETLFTEVRHQGVGVTVVCPGFFASELLAGGRFDTDLQRQTAVDMTGGAPITAEDVARATLRAVAARRLYVILPLRARLLWNLKRFFPRVWLRILAWSYPRHLAAGSTSPAKQPQPPPT
jgi:NAD(P)-dependent dehydrogenase (short-subunit alcohol dehydrogenase family)